MSYRFLINLGQNNYVKVRNVYRNDPSGFYRHSMNYMQDYRPYEGKRVFTSIYKSWNIYGGCTDLGFDNIHSFKKGGKF
jgi:hypothetical protein